MKTSRPTVDWPRIELEYCANEDSIREIADRHAISDTAIRKRAKAEKWVRLVRTPPSANQCEPELTAPPPRPVDPSEPVDPVAIADGGRGLVWRMLDELDATTTRRGELEDMIIAATEGDDDTARRESMMRAVSLSSRANNLKTLALAFKTLNEASAPQGKKAAAQERATQIGGSSRFGSIGPPKLKAVQ